MTLRESNHAAADASAALARQLRDALDRALADMVKADGYDDDMLAATAFTVCALLASGYLVRVSLARVEPVPFLESIITRFAESVATNAIVEYRAAIRTVHGLN